MGKTDPTDLLSRIRMPNTQGLEKPLIDLSSSASEAALEPVGCFAADKASGSADRDGHEGGDNPRASILTPAPPSSGGSSLSDRLPGARSLWSFLGRMVRGKTRVARWFDARTDPNITLSTARRRYEMACLLTPLRNPADEQQQAVFIALLRRRKVQVTVKHVTLDDMQTRQKLLLLNVDGGELVGRHNGLKTI